MTNKSLIAAKMKKNDEFYTQFIDIEREISVYVDRDPDVFRGQTVLLPCDDPEWSNFTLYFVRNFQRLGLKRLISTSYARESPSLFDLTEPAARGKILDLDHDIDGDGKIDFHDLEWHYLEGDGDFRSDEVKTLRDEADFIITNPPFSLFREFLNWIMEARKKFLIIGSLNVMAYKEVFPLIKNNKIWLGNGFHAGNAFFRTPGCREYANGVKDDTTGLVKFRNCGWYTNLDHGRRPQPLQLMTMEENIMYSKHKEIRGNGYLHYDNYDAIEVPYTDAIPSDYEGLMGVPISFLDKYCPEQFEIVCMTRNGDDGKHLTVQGKEPYRRIFIRHTQIVGIPVTRQ